MRPPFVVTPVFENVEFQDIRNPAPPFKKITPADIPKLGFQEIETLKYVILEDGKLIIAPWWSENIPLSASESARYSQLVFKSGFQGSPYILVNDMDKIIFDAKGEKALYLQLALKHPEIAGGKNVLAAGRVYVNQGKISGYHPSGKYGIDNMTGHYLVNGKAIKDIVETTFYDHGFTDALHAYKERTFKFSKGKLPGIVDPARFVVIPKVPDPIQITHQLEVNTKPVAPVAKSPQIPAPVQIADPLGVNAKPVAPVAKPPQTPALSALTDFNQLTPAEKTTLLNKITSTPKASGLSDATLWHGTIEKHVPTIQKGVQNVGRGFGGAGLYCALGREGKSYAAEFSFIASGNNPGSKEALVKGKFNAGANVRIAEIHLPKRTGSDVNLLEGIFPSDWAKNPTFKQFMIDNFDAIIINGGESKGYASVPERFVVLHESVNPKAQFNWKLFDKEQFFKLNTKVNGTWNTVFGTCYTHQVGNTTVVTQINSHKFTPLTGEPAVAIGKLGKLADTGIKLGVGAVGIGFTAWNLYGDYQQSKINNPELSVWLHGTRAIGATGTELAFWTGAGLVSSLAVGTQWAVFPLAVMSHAARQPSPHQCWQDVQTRINPQDYDACPISDSQQVINIQECGDPRGRYHGFKPEAYHRLSAQEQYYLNPEAQENYAFWLMCQPIGKAINYVVDSAKEMILGKPPIAKGEVPQSLPEAGLTRQTPDGFQLTFQIMPRWNDKLGKSFDTNLSFLELKAFEEKNRLPVDFLQNPAQFDDFGLKKPKTPQDLKDAKPNLIPPQSHDYIRKHKIDPFLGCTDFLPKPLPKNSWIPEYVKDLKLDAKFDSVDGSFAAVASYSWSFAEFPIIPVTVTIVCAIGDLIYGYHKRKKARHEKHRIERQIKLVGSDIEKEDKLYGDLIKNYEVYLAATDPTEKTLAWRDVCRALKKVQNYNQSIYDKNKEWADKETKRKTVPGSKKSHKHYARKETQEFIKKKALPFLKKVKGMIGNDKQALYQEILGRVGDEATQKAAAEILNQTATDFVNGKIEEPAFLVVVEGFQAEKQNLITQLIDLTSCFPKGSKERKILHEIIVSFEKEIKPIPDFISENKARRAYHDQESALFIDCKKIGSELDALSKKFLEGEIKLPAFKEKTEKLFFEEKALLDKVNSLILSPYHSAGDRLDFTQSVLDQDIKNGSETYIKNNKEQKQYNQKIKKYNEALNYYNAHFPLVDTLREQYQSGIILEADFQTQMKQLSDSVNTLAKLDPELDAKLQAIPQDKNTDQPIMDLTERMTQWEYGKSFLLDRAEKDILKVTLLKIEELLKKPDRTADDNVVLTQYFSHFDAVWQTVTEKSLNINFLTVQGQFALTAGHLQIAKTAAESIQALNPQHVDGIKLWITVNVLHGSPQATIQDFIQKQDAKLQDELNAVFQYQQNLQLYKQLSPGLIDLTEQYQAGTLLVEDFKNAVLALQTSVSNMQNADAGLEEHPERKQFINEARDFIQDYAAHEILKNILDKIEILLNKSERSSENEVELRQYFTEANLLWQTITNTKTRLDLLVKLGEYSLHAGFTEAAKEISEKVNQIDPKFLSGLHLWIKTQVAKGSPEATIQAYIQQQDAKCQDALNKTWVSSQKVFKYEETFLFFQTRFSKLNELSEQYYSEIITEAAFVQALAELKDAVLYLTQQASEWAAENAANPSPANLARVQYFTGVAAYLLDYAPTRVMHDSLIKIDKLVKQDKRSDDDKAKLKNLYQKVLEEWNKVNDKKANVDLLLNLAQLAHQAGDYETAKPIIDTVLTLTDDPFPVFIFELKNSHALGSTKEDLLAIIEANASKYSTEREKAILEYQKAHYAADREGLLKAFEAMHHAMKDGDKAECIKMLSLCFGDLEGKDKIKRDVLKSVANPDALPLYKLGPCQVLLKESAEFRVDLNNQLTVNAEKKFELETKIASLSNDPEKKSEIDALLYDLSANALKKVELEKQIEQNENVCKGAAFLFLEGLGACRSQDIRTRLKQVSYAYLGVDLFTRVFGVKMARMMGSTAPEEEVAFTAPLVSQLFQGIEAVCSHYKIKAEATRPEDLASLTDAERKAVAPLLAASEETLAEQLESFFQDNKTQMLLTGIRLAIALTNYILFRYYRYEVTRKKKYLPNEPRPRNFQEWIKLQSNSWRAAISKRADQASFAMDWGQWGQNSIPFALRLCTNQIQNIGHIKGGINSVIYLPQLSEWLLGNMEKDSILPTNWYRTFFGVFIRSMNSGGWKSLLSIHMNTILHAFTDISIHAGVLNVAEMALPFVAPNLSLALYCLNFAWSFGEGILQTDAQISDARHHNLNEELKKYLEDWMKAQVSSVSSQKAVATLRAIGLIRLVKSEARYFGAKHPRRQQLYIEAMFREHFIAKEIESHAVIRDGNGFFNAVANYTEESPTQLRALAVKYIKTHATFFQPFMDKITAKEADIITLKNYLAKMQLSGEPVDELIIRALSSALNRPIIIIFTGLEFNLAQQGLYASDTIIAGEPIFVEYNQIDESYGLYDAIWMRNEECFEVIHAHHLDKALAAPVIQAPAPVDPLKEKQERKKLIQEADALLKALPSKVPLAKEKVKQNAREADQFLAALNLGLYSKGFKAAQANAALQVDSKFSLGNNV